ncbi:MAG: hypothetical protein M3022_07335, partial [Actinomycetota bacterium]|nr:hypothetical protein [Actinomycetota bacterium]
MVDDGGEVLLPATVADLVDTDLKQLVQPGRVEAVGDDTLDDVTDGVPADPQQPGDRRLGHLLRQPRNHVFEVAGVLRRVPRPRDRLEMHATIRAAKAPQLTLDHAPVRAQVDVPPALGSPVVDLEPAGLTAATADPSAAAQANGHDHPFAAEAHVDDGRARQAQEPVECRGDAHAALLRRQQDLDNPAACRRERRRHYKLRNSRSVVSRPDLQHPQA